MEAMRLLAPRVLSLECSSLNVFMNRPLMLVDVHVMRLSGSANRSSTLRCREVCAGPIPAIRSAGGSSTRALAAASRGDRRPDSRSADAGADCAPKGIQRHCRMLAASRNVRLFEHQTLHKRAVRTTRRFAAPVMTHVCRWAVKNSGK